MSQAMGLYCGLRKLERRLELLDRVAQLPSDPLNPERVIAPRATKPERYRAQRRLYIA